MIDIFVEHLMTIEAVCRHLPGRSGGHVHTETVRQWASSGRRGAVLETVKVGGIRYTSKEALRRFVRALNGDASEEPQIGSSAVKGSVSREKLRARFGI